MSKKVKITFIKSPTGAFKLSYFEGDTVDMNEDQAHELMELGFAKPVISKTAPRVQRATAKPAKKETRKAK